MTSMELIGAPGVLIRNVKDGFSDFITMTYDEKVSGNGLRSGISKGTDSLIVHSIHGISSTAASNNPALTLLP